MLQVLNAEQLVLKRVANVRSWAEELHKVFKVDGGGYGRGRIEQAAQMSDPSVNDVQITIRELDQAGKYATTLLALLRSPELRNHPAFQGAATKLEPHAQAILDARGALDVYPITPTMIQSNPSLNQVFGDAAPFRAASSAALSGMDGVVAVSVELQAAAKLADPTYIGGALRRIDAAYADRILAWKPEAAAELAPHVAAIRAQESWAPG